MHSDDLLLIRPATKRKRKWEKDYEYESEAAEDEPEFDSDADSDSNEDSRQKTKKKKPSRSDIKKLRTMRPQSGTPVITGSKRSVDNAITLTRKYAFLLPSIYYLLIHVYLCKEPEEAEERLCPIRFTCRLQEAG